MEYGARPTHYTTAHERCSRVTGYSSRIGLWKRWRQHVQVTSRNKTPGQSSGRRASRSAVAQDYLRHGDLSTSILRGRVTSERLIATHLTRAHRATNVVGHAASQANIYGVARTQSHDVCVRLWSDHDARPSDAMLQ